MELPAEFLIWQVFTALLFKTLIFNLRYPELIEIPLSSFSNVIREPWIITYPDQLGRIDI